MHCQLVFKCLIYRDERGTERKVRGETNYVVEWDVFLVQSWTCVSYSIEEKKKKKEFSFVSIPMYRLLLQGRGGGAMDGTIRFCEVYVIVVVYYSFGWSRTRLLRLWNSILFCVIDPSLLFSIEEEKK